MLNNLLKYKKIIIIAAVLFVGFVLFFSLQKGEAQEEIKNQKKQVSLINLQEYSEQYEGIVSTGEVESLGQVQLKSEVIGKVARVNVEIGQEVKKGQTLVVFSNADLVASRNQAYAGYEQAIASKENIEAQYKAQEATLQKIKITGQNSINTAKASLQTAENNLKLNKDSENSEIVAQEYDKMGVLLTSVQNILSSSLNAADSILGVDNTLANDSFENFLSTIDYSALNRAETEYRRAKAAKINFDAKIKVTNSNSSYQEIDELSELGKDTLSNFSTMLVSVSEMLNNTVPIGDLSQTQLDSLKSSINNTRNSVATATSNLTVQIQAIKNSKNSLTSFEISYQKALRDLEDVKAQVAADIETSQAQLEQLAASIKSQDASIKNASASVSFANAQIGKTVVSAPISGKIASLPAKVGEFISSGQDVVSIVNTEGLKVKAFIDSTEISEVSVGNEVLIEDIYKGTVSNVAPSVDSKTKKVEVIVVIDEEYKENFVVGQFVDLKILPSKEKAEQDTSIFLPLEAVKINAQGKFVYAVDSENKIITILVDIDRIVGNKVEVVSGLDDVEYILSSIGNVEEGEEVEVIN